jgi:hypothetical protein
MAANETQFSIVRSSRGEDELSDRWTGAAGLAVAAIALGYCISIEGGGLRRETVLALTFSLVAAMAAASIGSLWSVEKLGDRPTVFLLAIGMVFQVGQLLIDPVGVDLGDSKVIGPFSFALVAATLLAGSNLSEHRWLGRLQVPLLLLAHVALGAWILQTSSIPDSAVHSVQRNAADALLHGRTPYELSFPELKGRGFPYPPLTLMLDALGQAIAGDHRYAQLLAITISGALMAYARPGRVGAIAAALFLFTPRMFLVLQQGWTETFLVLALSASVWCACRRPKIFPFALGMLFALKAYLVLGLPAASLMLRRPFKRKDVLNLSLKAIGTALVVTFPLAAWAPAAFLRSVGTLELDPTFKPEPLSYLAYFAREGGLQFPSAVAYVAAAFAAALALWRAPRTAAGFSAALALTFGAFFAFHPAATFNHYFLVVGALCCSIAATGLPGTMSDVEEMKAMSMVTRIGEASPK